MENTYKTYIKPIVKANLLGIMFWGGLFLVFIGSIFGDTIDSWAYVPSGTGKALLNGGGAILGAGVFGAILKTSQYTKIFQKNIMDVMYSPSRINSNEILLSSWRFLTNELLKNVLPAVYNDVTEHIERKFFNNELDYHFENYKITYDINIDDNNIATVRTTINANIVIASNRENPVFEQEIINDGETALLKLVINGDDIVEKQNLEQHKDKKDTYLLTFKFKDFGILPNEKDDTRIDFERVIEQKQNLRNDVCLFTTIRRYVKGFEVKAKVSDGFKLSFDTLSLDGLEDNRYWPNDGTGYEKWLLAKPGEFIIPGDGFNIVIMKK